MICRLFHSVTTISRCLFYDLVSNKPVGLYSCKNCNKEFMAYSRWSIFRCYKKEVSNEAE